MSHDLHVESLTPMWLAMFGGRAFKRIVEVMWGNKYEPHLRGYQGVPCACA